MDVSDIGRQFSALYLSPFLNAGATFACFQSLSMVPVSIDCELLLIAPFLFIFSFFKGLHVLGFFDQSYDFSRKSLSKYLMDTIDFNKHDIDIYINLTKIVRYGRH